MPSINATPKSTFQSSPGSPLIGPSLPPSTLSPLFNPQSPKLVNNNLNSPKMDYSPKPGFTPRIKPPTPTTPATSKFQPVSNTITPPPYRSQQQIFQLHLQKCHQWEVISMLISCLFSNK